VASTITQVSSLININYPIPGVDNDSQGFRSNFSSIRESLKIANDEISRLQISTDSGDDNIIVAPGKHISFADNSVFIGEFTQSFVDTNNIKLALGKFQLGGVAADTYYGAVSEHNLLAFVSTGSVAIGNITSNLMFVDSTTARPSTGGTLSLGNTAFPWKQAFVSDYLSAGGNGKRYFGTTNQAMYDAGYDLSVGSFILGTDTVPTFHGMASSEEDIAIVAKPNGAVRIGPIEGLTEVHSNNIKTSLASNKFEVQMGTLTGAQYNAKDFKIGFGKFIFDGPPPVVYYGIGAPDDDVAIVAKPNGILRLGPLDALIEVGQDFVRPAINNQKSMGTSGFRWSEVYASNGTIQTSDQRLKTDIEDSSLGLDFINDLRSVSFKLLDDTEQRVHWGLIAQEVKQTIDKHDVNFGGWSEGSDDTKTQHLNYSEFVSPLIKAVQELSIENQELKSQIAEIKKHLGL
jgi:hypothetical protein